MDLKFGAYVHKTNGSIAIASKPKEGGMHFEIDKDKKQKVWLGGAMSVTTNLVETGTGEYFFNNSLRNYEYLGEL